MSDIFGYFTQLSAEVGGESPWDNPDNTSADQSSGDIKYTAGNVGIGGNPEEALHLHTGKDFRLDFNGSGAGRTYQLITANDGAGNWHEYLNTTGTTTPVRVTDGYAIQQEYNANNQWYQFDVADNNVAGSAISWLPALWLNMNDAQIRFPQYGDGDFDTNAHSYFLAVETDGDIVEQPKRMANPGDPTITVGGSGVTLNSVNILDRWSDLQSYSYRIRCLTSVAAGTGWGYVIVPTKAGFQQPEIKDVGSYRTTGNAVQEDTTGGVGSRGASPFGPYMGKEWHHWSSTNRIYQGYNRRDNAFSSYVEFTVTYRKT